MNDQFASVESSAAYDPSETNTKRLAKQSPANARNELLFFGKDGFTFLDLLDVINPLQHIPIISTLYRSISGDTIDPGAKIAGGMLFGGPLGAAVSSLDVAVKHSTGRDIADHTTALFTIKTDGENTPTLSETSLKMAALEPTQLADRSNRGQATASVLRPTKTENRPLSDEPIYPGPPGTQIIEEKFRAAGMSAIPIAKRRSNGYGQDVTNAPRPFPRPALHGDIVKPSAPQNSIEAPKASPLPALSVRASNNDVTEPGQDRLTRSEPYRLKAKFPGGVIPIALSKGGRTRHLTQTFTEGSVKSSRQWYGHSQAINRTITDNKNSWIADAMKRGLSKYEAANNLAAGSNQKPAFTVR